MLISNEKLETKLIKKEHELNDHEGKNRGGGLMLNRKVFNTNMTSFLFYLLFVFVEFIKHYSIGFLKLF